MPTSLRLVPDEPEPEHRLPYSFEMSQPDPLGMVLIDACIPAAMALVFFKLLQEYFEE